MRASIFGQAQKPITRELQRTIRFLRSGEASYFDAENLLHAVGKHLSLQFPAEQQNDTKEFMDKLLDRVRDTWVYLGFPLVLIVQTSWRPSWVILQRRTS